MRYTRSVMTVNFSLFSENVLYFQWKPASFTHRVIASRPEEDLLHCRSVCMAGCMTESWQLWSKGSCKAEKIWNIPGCRSYLWGQSCSTHYRDSLGRLYWWSALHYIIFHPTPNHNSPIDSNSHMRSDYTWHILNLNYNHL